MSSKKAAKKAKQGQKKEAEQGRALLVAAGRGDCGAMGRLLDGGLDVNALAETGTEDGRGQPLRTTALVQGPGQGPPHGGAAAHGKHPPP